MKTPILSCLILIALAGAAVAQANASSIAKQLDKLDAKVDADVADGALTKPDGDELKLEISEARSVETSDSTLTHGTRRNLRQKISKIHKDLALKEGQAKALASASPSATP